MHALIELYKDDYLVETLDTYIPEELARAWAARGHNHYSIIYPLQS